MTRGNTYSVSLTSVTIDLSVLPGFDVTRATGWSGGSINGSILTVPGNGEVAYIYDCGNGHSAEFTLDITLELTMDDPDMVLPSSLITIEEEAFMNTGASVIAIPDTATSIGDRTFYGSSSLRQIYIPSSVTSIGTDAFTGCTNNLINF